MPSIIVPRIALPLDAPKSMAKKVVVVFSLMVFHGVMNYNAANIEISCD